MIPKIGDWNVPWLGDNWSDELVQKYLNLCSNLEKFEWTDGDIWEKITVHKKRRSFCPLMRNGYDINQVWISVRNTRTGERYYGCAVQFFPNDA